MLIIILLLIFVAVLAITKYIIKKKYGISLMLMVTIIICLITYLYFFTLLPMQLGIIETPSIEIVRIGKIKEFKTMKTKYLEDDAAVLISSDKKIDEDAIVFSAMQQPDFKYDDIYSKKGTNNDLILRSYCSYFFKKYDDKYLYIVPFSVSGSVITDNDFYCKVFLVRMFRPVYQINETKMPLDSLLRNVIFGD